MKRLFLILAVCACVVGASTLYVNAQRTRTKASGNYVTRDVPNFGRFDAIRTEGSIDVEYTQSTDGTISVKKYGSDNVIEYVEVLNENGTLVARIRTPKNMGITWNNHGKLKVIVSGPALKKVKSTGSSDIYLINNINTGDLVFETSGSGDIKFNSITCDNLKASSAGSSDLKGGNLICKTLDISTAGSGDAEIDHVSAASVKITTRGSSDIKVAGKATDVIISVAGSGGVDAYGLHAETVKASASGSGDISCYATKRLDASSTGSAGIVYGGNPATVNIPVKQRGIRPR